MRWPRQILFGDVDAMFASAAIVKDPGLAGKSVAVGGPPPRGIIAAASYAVRAFGVRSAMPTIEAYRLCPDLILIPPDRPLYRRLHEHMQAVTDRLFPTTEWSSIDEFYADTTSLQNLHPDPFDMGRRLKQAILDDTGLRCTVALATSKTVAKIAADAAKPDGLAVVPPGTEAAFLADRPLRALPGVGPKTGARLQELGLRVIGDLFDVRWEQPLRRLFGSRFHWIREAAQGIDGEPVVADRESKSLSHETTFEQDTDALRDLEEVLHGFLRTLARDLRQEGLAAASCTVKLKDSRFVITTKQRRFSRALNYDPDMWPTVRQTLREAMKQGTKYRLAGLALASLVTASPGLFEKKRSQAIEAMDRIAARYGTAVIGLGGVDRE
ncbi:MAG TPA: DNA polymerase IV [Nitrospira sp.]|nr:DNA polymerase IV [Nitrospira sp.]